MLMLQFEFLPNELFIHGIFRYLSLVDLHYAFAMLNERFNQLVASFLAERVHHIHLTSNVTFAQMTFIIDHVHPHLSDNQLLQSVEFSHADLFLRFFDKVHQMKTDYLTRIILTSYMDIHFDPMMTFIYTSYNLKQVNFKVLTNLDKSWANGRKWAAYFDKMLENNRRNILQSLDICVYCIENTDAVKFDSRLWDIGGVYRNNTNWKVHLQPEQASTWQRSRQTVEFSRCDQHYLTLSLDKQTATCILS